MALWDCSEDAYFAAHRGDNFDDPILGGVSPGTELSDHGAVGDLQGEGEGGAAEAVGQHGVPAECGRRLLRGFLQPQCACHGVSGQVLGHH